VFNRHSEHGERSTAKPCGWLEKQSWAFQIGLLIGAAHMLFMIMTVVYIIRHHEGRWHMFWILCGYIDFPVSLLLPKVILPVLSPLFTHADPYLAARYNSPLFAVFSLFHILVGSGWYFALPILVHKASRKITATTAGAAAAAAMMIIPIPSNWLQLLRFIGNDTTSVAIGLNSILPCIWTVLLVWLFVANPRRKVLLWLFCLAPPVFYYLVRDLYYYTLLTSR
jgi:hypothetical protein